MGLWIGVKIFRFWLAAAFSVLLTVIVIACSGGPERSGQDTLPNSAQNQVSGVLMWKGDSSGSGQYGGEIVLTPLNVNDRQFGKKAEYKHRI